MAGFGDDIIGGFVGAMGKQLDEVADPAVKALLKTKLGAILKANFLSNTQIAGGVVTRLAVSGGEVTTALKAIPGDSIIKFKTVNGDFVTFNRNTSTININHNPNGIPRISITNTLTNPVPTLDAADFLKTLPDPVKTQLLRAKAKDNPELAKSFYKIYDDTEYVSRLKKEIQESSSGLAEKTAFKELPDAVQQRILKDVTKFKNLTDDVFRRSLDDAVRKGLKVPSRNIFSRSFKYAGKPFKWAKENPGRAVVWALEVASFAMGVIFILSIFGLDMDFLSPEGNKSKKCNPEDWLDPECMDTLAQSPIVQAIAGGCCSLSSFCCVMICMCGMMMTMQSGSSSS